MHEIKARRPLVLETRNYVFMHTRRKTTYTNYCTTAALWKLRMLKKGCGKYIEGIFVLEPVIHHSMFTEANIKPCALVRSKYACTRLVITFSQCVESLAGYAHVYKLVMLLPEASKLKKTCANYLQPHHSWVLSAEGQNGSLALTMLGLIRKSV